MFGVCFILFVNKTDFFFFFFFSSRRRHTRLTCDWSSDVCSSDLAAHEPYRAALEAAPAGPVAVVHLTLKDVVHQIAPGIKYNAWAFSGGAPGPVIHVRQGLT